jgi:hypothetical protein
VCTYRAGGALELLLSPEVSFVRDILLEELAKGIDAGWRLAVDELVGQTRAGVLEALGVRMDCLDAAIP